MNLGRRQVRPSPRRGNAHQRQPSRPSQLSRPSQPCVQVLPFDEAAYGARLSCHLTCLGFGELIDDLRDRIRPAGDERRFEVAWAESLAMVTFVSGDQREALDRLIGAELFAEGP